MAKPSRAQEQRLARLSDDVLNEMHLLGKWDQHNLDQLHTIPHAVLRRNATQRHGVTRFRRRAKGCELKTEDVETIDLHPQLLDEAWGDYARFVLYHEYLHALGNRFHDAPFRTLEELWPFTGAERGREFTQFLRQSTATWLWVCETCDKQYPRKTKANRRYRCRICSSILIDVANMQEAN